MDEHRPITRPASQDLDAILGVAFRVLDDGFVRAVDYLGNDSSIVQAARVSYGAGTKSTSEDRSLLRYLMRQQHTTPFEMCEIKFHVRVPMDTWRQWIRHRTANVNEYSTRYSIAIDRAQSTDPSGWRIQGSSNRQGSEGTLDPAIGKNLSEEEAKLQTYARDVYNGRLKAGVAREQARKDLPLSTYTEAYWKIDLHNLLHFLRLRLHSTAQFEIRQYASVIGDIVAKWVPHTWEAFVDYELTAMTLSQRDIELLRLMDSADHSAALNMLKELRWDLRDTSGRLKVNRERSEFVAKYLRMFGREPFWLDE